MPWSNLLNCECGKKAPPAGPGAKACRDGRPPGAAVSLRSALCETLPFVAPRLPPPVPRLKAVETVIPLADRWRRRSGREAPPPDRIPIAEQGRKRHAVCRTGSPARSPGETEFHQAVHEVLETLANRPDMVHVVLTGRHASDELLEAAELATEMTLVKHPFRSGIKAQPGVEF